jgi:hypothetical protein
MLTQQTGHAPHNRELLAEGERIVWTAEDPDSDAVYVALFNKASAEALEVEVPLADLGLAAAAEAGTSGRTRTWAPSTAPSRPRSRPTARPW